MSVKEGKPLTIGKREVPLFWAQGNATVLLPELRKANLVLEVSKIEHVCGVKSEEVIVSQLAPKILEALADVPLSKKDSVLLIFSAEIQSARGGQEEGLEDKWSHYYVTGTVYILTPKPAKS